MIMAGRLYNEGKRIQMNNYEYHVPTDIRFGRGQIACLSDEIGKYGKRVLLVYGGGSIKKSGLYDRVYESLKGF